MNSSKIITQLMIEAADKSYNGPLSYVPKPSLKPSSLGTPCLRKLYYEYFRIEKDDPFDAEKIDVFEMGNLYHDLLRLRVKRTGKYIEYRDSTGKVPKHWETGDPNPEFPVTAKDLLVNKGKLDGIAVFDGKVWVYEFKSKKSKKFKYLKEPDRDHLTQGTFYAFVFEQLLREGAYAHIPELEGITEVGGAIYIYVEKGSEPLNIKEYWVPKDEAYFEQIVLKILKIQEFIESKKLPPKTPDFCDWCNFRKKCDREFKVD